MSVEAKICSMREL